MNLDICSFCCAQHWKQKGHASSLRDNSDSESLHCLRYSPISTRAAFLFQQVAAVKRFSGMSECTGKLTSALSYSSPCASPHRLKLPITRLEAVFEARLRLFDRRRIPCEYLYFIFISILLQTWVIGIVQGTGTVRKFQTCKNRCFSYEKTVRIIWFFHGIILKELLTSAEEAIRFANHMEILGHYISNLCYF